MAGLSCWKNGSSLFLAPLFLCEWQKTFLHIGSIWIPAPCEFRRPKYIKTFYRAARQKVGLN